MDEDIYAGLTPLECLRDYRDAFLYAAAWGDNIFDELSRAKEFRQMVEEKTLIATVEESLIACLNHGIPIGDRTIQKTFYYMQRIEEGGKLTKAEAEQAGLFFEQLRVLGFRMEAKERLKPKRSRGRPKGADTENIRNTFDTIKRDFPKLTQTQIATRVIKQLKLGAKTKPASIVALCVTRKKAKQ